MPVPKWNMIIHQMEWASRFFKQTHLSACKRYHHIRVLPARCFSVKCCLIYTNYNLCVHIYIYIHIWLVVSNMAFIFHIWDVILPIDELHHFSRWLLHHQPDIYICICICIYIYSCRMLSDGLLTGFKPPHGQ